MSSSHKVYDRRIDPAATSAAELVSYLGVDPAQGLSPKEAERRLEASTARSLFVKPPRRLTECLKQVAKEPALWMLLAVSVISLFFDRVLLGAVCALLALCAVGVFGAKRHGRQGRERFSHRQAHGPFGGRERHGQLRRCHGCH